MDNMTYEAAVTRLEEIVAILEKNEVPLDESLKLFEEGTNLAGFCSNKLDSARAKIMEIEKE